MTNVHDFSSPPQFAFHTKVALMMTGSQIAQKGHFELEQMVKEF